MRKNKFSPTQMIAKVLKEFDNGKSVEQINQVRKQTHIWMNDYNHHKPHDALGKIPPIK